MSEAKPNIHFIEFNNRKVPKFLEVKNKDYISYGEKNDYPYYLIDLYKRSSFHCAIINGKVNYISGAGWSYDKRGLATVAQKAQAEKILSQPFADVDLNETTRRIAFDFELFNGFCFLVKWAKNRKTCTIEHIDFCNVRSNVDGSVYYYTKGWFTYKAGVARENKKPEEEKDWQVYNAYDPEDRTGTQIYYYRTSCPDQYQYPLPGYVGGVTWIENHIRYGDFQHANISKSFSPAKVINIYGTIPPDDMQKTITENIKNNFSGEEGDRLVVNFALSEQAGIKVDSVMVEDQANLYKELADQSLQNIFTSHEITSPMLFGIRTEGQLGGRSEMLDAFEILQNTYVNARQRVIESCINEVAGDIGIGIKFKLNKNSPVSAGDLLEPEKQKVLNALSGMSPLVANKVLESMSSEEIRGLVGLKGSFVSTSQSKFSVDRPANIELFKSCGSDALKFEVIEERDIPTIDPIEMEKFERDYLGLQFSTVKLKNLERSVLDLLIKDPYLDIVGLAKATKAAPADVRGALDRLLERELITPYKESIAGEKTRAYEVSKEATKTLSEEPAKTSDYEVMYRYDVAAGMGARIIAGTRDFCRKIIEMARLYTREEINQMSDKEGRNVWALRGGWYHNPKTGVNESSCRHTWKQVIVKRK